jgi:DNA-binding XRE family transcriptional regulator
VAQPGYGAAGSPGTAGSPIEVVPVVVLSQVFTARPSSIPDIRDFVRRCLAESPLTDQGNREVSETVFRALLDAAGPTGSIQVAFRIFPEHVEVDVLHSDTTIQPPTMPGPPVSMVQPVQVGPPGSSPQTGQGAQLSHAAQLAQAVRQAQAAEPGAPPNGQPGSADAVAPGQPGPAETFAEWMSSALRREGLTQEAAARQLGVSVKTVSRWVGGATEPRMRDLRRIQEVFGEVPLP